MARRRTVGMISMAMFSQSLFAEQEHAPRFVFDATVCLPTEERVVWELNSARVEVLGREGGSCLFRTTVEAEGSSVESLCAAEKGPVGISSRGPDRGLCTATRTGGIEVTQNSESPSFVEIGRMVRGKREGLWTIYLDQEPGPWRWATVEYRGGLRDGEFRSYNGGIDHGHYRKGRKQGHWIENPQSITPGRLRDEEGDYAGGLRTGTWVGHDNEGLVRLIATYRAGKMHGPYVVYYSDGTKYQAGSFDNDSRSGVWRSWYTTGALEEESSYCAGVEDGRVRRWSPNGEVREDRVYVDGHPLNAEANKASKERK